MIAFMSLEPIGLNQKNKINNFLIKTKLNGDE